MDLQILSSNPGCNGSFLLGPFSPFPCDCVVEKMTDSSQFSLDGLAEDEPDSVLVCKEEEESSPKPIHLQDDNMPAPEEK
jgi:hypothetical protein